MVDSDKYVGVLSRHIRLQPAKKNEIVCELEDHIEDKTSDLVHLGIRLEAAQSLAVRQMGDPIALARQLHDVHCHVSLKHLGLAVVPHVLLAGLIALNLCGDFLAVGLTLGLIVCVTWYNWRSGNPGRWSYSWLAFSLFVPVIVLLLTLIAPGKSIPAGVAGNQFPVNPYLMLFFGGYLLLAFWFLARVVYRIVQQDWLIVAFTALPIVVLTGWRLVSEWRDVTWAPQFALVGGNGAPWILVFLSIAAITAIFLKLSLHSLRASYLLIATLVLTVIAYAALVVNYHLEPVGLTMVALVAVLLMPSLRKTLASSLRILQSILQTMLHLIWK